MQADGDDMRAPGGGADTGAAARGNATAIESHRHSARFEGLGGDDGCAQVKA